MSTCLRGELIPTQIMLETLLGVPIPACIYEDNAATITAISKGYSPTLRYLPRTQCISLGFLHETLRPDEDGSEDELERQIVLEKADTDDHKGDIMTKKMPRMSFETKLRMLGMMPVEEAHVKLPNVCALGRSAH